MSKFIDWQVIRVALIVLTLSLIISGSLVWGSMFFKDAMDREYRQHNAVFQANSNQYLAVDEEENMIDEFYPAFIASYNKGKIGRERRLDWIESLRSTGVELKLPSLNYSLSSRTAYIPDFQVNLGGYGFFKSEMTLRIQLSHEGDLFSLLSSLEDKAKGMFRIVECGFNSSIRDKPVEDINASNVQVDCILEWITLNLASGAEIKVES